MADMSAPDTVVEDPLIAALPPNTDYITYLTILEYQLTPRNLPTLNRLLQDDDGTLASEIGWDLLKLVLPILRVEPNKAKECLDIIARRGNPREVIVRVSEELETLGVQDSDGEADPTESTHNIPTFVGEAPHVHLGQMTLAGMPPSEAPRPQSQHSEQHFPDATVEELKLQSLLSMLSSLHPRIKTKYPSRFLATSLPAALAAYRRLSMNTESTLAFLDTLTKLSGRTRPNLPPRIPTADMLRLNSIPEAATITSAPLPDPESKVETTTTSPDISASEQAINQRLVQAVLLEVLEEYTAASSEAQPPLAARLRIRHEPQSLSSTRKEELDTLATTSQAVAADRLRSKFIDVSKNLKIDVRIEIANLFEPPAQGSETEEEHEYPTSPSQIPVAKTGLLLLHCAQVYVQTEHPSSQIQTTPIPTTDTNIVLQLVVDQYHEDARLRQSGPALDYILSLLYAIFCTTSTKSSSTITDQSILLSTFTVLKDIFTACPDPDLRDNAHHIATHIFHAYFSPPARLIIIKDLLTSTTTSSSTSPVPLHPSQTGPLKALAVSWLKDEIYPTSATTTIMQALSDPSERGLPKSTITGLTDVLFPTESIPDPPSTTTTITSPTTIDPTSNLAQISESETNLETFTDNLPFYISSLNLLCVFIRTHNATPPDDTDADAAETPEDTLELDSLIVTIASFLEKLEGWSGYLAGRLAGGTGAGTDHGDGDGEVEGISLADVFALEDAVGRAREVVGERKGDVAVSAGGDGGIDVEREER